MDHTILILCQIFRIENVLYEMKFNQVWWNFPFILQNITAVLNFQCRSEQENWGIDGEAIKEALEKDGVQIIDYPIR